MSKGRQREDIPHYGDKNPQVERPSARPPQKPLAAYPTVLGLAL